MPKITPARSTHHINRHAAENICHAIDFAKNIDLPLNLYVVLNLDENGSGIEGTEIFRRVRHKFRDWLNRCLKKRGITPSPPVYVYSHENPANNPHVNWMVHVPAFLRAEFLEKLPRWLERSQGAVRKFDIDVQAIDPHTDKALAKYILKGTDERYVPYLHLQDYASPQGQIFGRRATASPAIGRKARRDAGFVPKLHRNNWKRHAA